MALTDDQAFNRALDLFIESLYKPDHELRNAAKGDGVLLELMAIRQHCLTHCQSLRK